MSRLSANGRKLTSRLAREDLPDAGGPFNKISTAPTETSLRTRSVPMIQWALQIDGRVERFAPLLIGTYDRRGPLKITHLVSAGGGPSKGPALARRRGNGNRGRASKPLPRPVGRLHVAEVV
jgi:hypothetical protein